MSEEKTITIEVDGQSLETKPGALLIDVTDAAGINIPRFCYHNKLSIAASCRMCLVEVAKVPKPIPACATQVMDGMVVQTRSPMALAAQKSTMEFLLINHPLDCPVCDQGGECELQDVAMGYGSDVTRFVEGKRVVPENNVGPLIATDMTRCIHCTRCVRFGDEVAGMREMGATGRGEHMTIGTYVARNVDSELSGNVIDLCPVGALTSKPFQYRARAWELTRHTGVAPHDSVGSNIQIHTRRNEVMRVHPQSNDAINEIWISDRDRFSYEGIKSEDRLTQPLVKKNGEWAEASWEDALEAAASGLKEAAADPSQVGTLVSPTATLEEIALAKKITEGLGSANIDYRLRQEDFRGNSTGVPWLGQTIASLESVDSALLIGSNIRKDQPLLAHRVRKAALNGAKIQLVNPLQLDLHFDAAQMVSDPAGMVHNLAAIAEAAGGTHHLTEEIEITDEHKAVAEGLKLSESAVILLGNIAQSHPDYTILYGLASVIAKATDSSVGVIPVAANSVGAAVLGAIPDHGLNAHTMLEDPRQGYLLLGVEPGRDTNNPMLARSALKNAECVVAVTAYRSSCLEETADVMLPMSAFSETSGSFVNAEGNWQTFSGTTTSAGESRPGWKILRVLGNLLDLQGFDYNSSEEILNELKDTHAADLKVTSLGTPKGKIRSAAAGLIRVGETPIYASDALVRRATSLQKTKDARDAAVARVNSSVASNAGLSDGDKVAVVQGEGRAEMVLKVDAHIPDGCVWVPAGVPGSESLGDQFGELSLEKV